jgi:hypothetical protein
MDLGMQRLHPPIHHLRRRRIRRHLDDGHPRLPQRLGRPPGRQYLDASSRQKPPKLHEPCLIRNRNQRPLDHLLAHADSPDIGDRRRAAFDKLRLRSDFSPITGFPHAELPHPELVEGRSTHDAGCRLTHTPRPRQRSPRQNRRLLTCSSFVHILLYFRCCPAKSRFGGTAGSDGRFLTSYIRPPPSGTRDCRPNPLAPGNRLLTSFTWGCSSDSKKPGHNS